MVKLVGYPGHRIAPQIDPDVGSGIGLDMFRHDRLADHLQPPYIRRVFGNAAMLMSQIIDKNGNRRLKFREDAV